MMPGGRAWPAVRLWRRSLNRRLLAGVLLVSVAYWGAIALLTMRDNVDEIDELFDRQLAQTALALLRVADPDEVEGDAPGAPAVAGGAGHERLASWGELPQRIAARRAGAAASAAAPDKPASTAQGESERRLRYQIWSNDGHLLLRSGNAPETPMASGEGFSEAGDANGRRWRHYVALDQHGDFRVIVGEDRALRDELVRGATLRMARPLALGLPVLGVLLWLAIASALAPLGALAREISSREPAALAPLDAAAAPREVQPMVQALNTLLGRISVALEGERRFTANAAHELRTPLAAIRAQLHLARSARDDDERREALDRLQQGLERGVRVVTQLLALARLDPETTLPDACAVDLGEIARTVCAELAPAALQRAQELSLEVSPGIPAARGNPDLLAMLLSNLVDNAIRYGRRDGHIDVTVSGRDDGVQVEVRDDGPGIPAALRERVFERFFRIEQEQPGTGLGLALVRRIAELHGGRVELADGDAGRGLRASLVLPRWTAAQAA